MDSSKLNSGGDGVSHGVDISDLICWIKSRGQSKSDGCKLMLRLSLSGGKGGIQGKFDSPSSCASCFVDDASVVSQCAFSRSVVDSRD